MRAPQPDAHPPMGNPWENWENPNFACFAFSFPSLTGCFRNKRQAKWEGDEQNILDIQASAWKNLGPPFLGGRREIGDLDGGK